MDGTRHGPPTPADALAGLCVYEDESVMVLRWNDKFPGPNIAAQVIDVVLGRERDLRARVSELEGYMRCHDACHADEGTTVSIQWAEIERLRRLIARLDHGGAAECDCPVCGHCFDAHAPDCAVDSIVDAYVACPHCDFVHKPVAGETRLAVWEAHFQESPDCDHADNRSLVPDCFRRVTDYGEYVCVTCAHRFVAADRRDLNKRALSHVRGSPSCDKRS